MSLRTILAPLSVVLVVVSCSVPDADTPAGVLTPSPSSQTSLPPSTALTTALAAIEACDLLTHEEATSLGVPAQGAPEEILGLRRCDWATQEGTVSTGINEELGIDGLNLDDASSVSDVTIGRHQAKRVVEGSGPGYCSVAFAVGDSANISVLALYLNDTPHACAIADRAAALIEPKLP
ncbi:MAG: DUF3558 family protein [Pseudonocardiaceae bacterium]